MNSDKTHPIIKNRCSIALLTALSFLAVTSARAQTLTVLHDFGSGIDGSNSRASLIRDTQGNLYGVTAGGGGTGYGTVFMMSASGVEKVLYNFTGSADGGAPWGALVRDSQGNLYGTTFYNGAYGSGVVFMTTRAGVETVLHTFTGGADGADPWAGLLRDAQGNLYGTTVYGGLYNDGTVFKVTPSGTETVLYTFRGTDGAYPVGALIQDAAGNFYGTTNAGGAHGYGAVFKLTLSGVLSVLYSFTGGADGNAPYSSLVQDSQGNLYGTTYYGGANNHGTVFEVSPSGSERVLHSFIQAGVDGGNPVAGLVQDSNGSLFGTTSTGGSYNDGTVFMVIPAGNIYRTVYSFTAGADGGRPNGGLVVDAQDNLYGITQSYGTYGGGAAFRLAP
jgi:uncharacterized repeat protein (TIGR03803 family)